MANEVFPLSAQSSLWPMQAAAEYGIDA